MSSRETIKGRPKGLAVADSPPVGRRFRATGASMAIEVVGDAWVIRLLRSSFRGARRFSEFQRSCDVSRAVLSDRLERMVGDGLLERREQPSHHAEYRLTERGLDLWSLFIGMWRWERQWGTGIDGAAPRHDRPRSRLVHLGCGHSIEPVLACQTCRRGVTPFDTFGAFRCEAGQEPETGQGRKRARKVKSDSRGELPTLLRVYGDRWNSMIIGAAFQGLDTFSDFEQSLAISPGQLSDRLEELQQLGLIRARAYAGSRRQYRLSRAAIELYPITVELVRWGYHWLCPGTPPMQIMHRPCGEPLTARWLCPSCDQWLQRTTIRFDPAGPADPRDL